MTNVNPWSKYWGTSNLQSSFFSQNSEDEAEVIQFWQGFAKNLIEDAKILDLATGNGIVPKILLDHNPLFHLVGVDQAAIKPELFFNEVYKPGSYKFHSNVDMCSLPFEKALFDGVTSQFGVEYSSSTDVYIEVSRVLKKYGRFQFLMHHIDSEPVKSSKLKTHEMSELMKDGGVIESLKNFARGQISFEQLEKSGGDYLNLTVNKTNQISGQLFNSIDQIFEVYATSKETAISLIGNLLERFYAQYERLMQMQNAAKNEKEMKIIIQSLESSGLNIERFETFHVGGLENLALVGWVLSGYK